MQQLAFVTPVVSSASDVMPFSLSLAYNSAQQGGYFGSNDSFTRDYQNMKLGSGFAPIRQMMDKGINVTLGTDGTASNNNLNMFEEMHLAEIMHDGYHNDPTLISTQEVLDMATVNGAKLQGRDDTGVLAVGKKADIIALDLSKPHLYPNFDTPALLTCSAQAGDVCMTMVDGNILYENGEFKTLDENKVRADMERAVERLYRK